MRLICRTSNRDWGPTVQHCGCCHLWLFKSKSINIRHCQFQAPQSQAATVTRCGCRNSVGHAALEHGGEVGGVDE